MTTPTAAPPPQPTPDRPMFVPRRKLLWILLAVYVLWIAAMWWTWFATRPGAPAPV